jgi:predicted RNA-binding protein Jag
MIKEFEGATKEEAVEKAAAELGINKEEFDVEILEETKGFLFSKGKVTIRVHVEEEEFEEEVSLSSEHEADVIEFLEGHHRKDGLLVQKSPSPAGRTTSSIWTSTPRTQTFSSANGEKPRRLQLLGQCLPRKNP